MSEKTPKKQREFPEGRAERVGFSMPSEIVKAFQAKYPRHGEVSEALTRLVKQDLGMV